ncbi:MAG TPA: zf-HC2 domain-containing protein [Frankiaceae bacterium]
MTTDESGPTPWGHLGDHVAAFVDGELGPDDRDRAVAHLAGCPACRREVDQQADLKRRLASATVPGPSILLDRRLRGLAGRAHTPARSPRPRPAARGLVGRRPSAPRGRRRALRATVVGGTLAAAASVTAAFLIGGGATSPPVAPAGARLVDQHWAVTTEVPLSEPGLSLAVLSAAP